MLPYGANPTDKFLIAAYEEAMFPIYQTVFKDMPGKEHPAFPFSSMEWFDQGQAILDEMGVATVKELNNRPADERNSLANNTQIVHLLYIIRMEKSLCRITDGSISWDNVTDDAAAEVLERSPKIFIFSSLTLEEIVAMVRFFQCFIRSDKRSEKVKRIAHTNISDLLGLHDFFFFSDEQIRELADILLNDSFFSSDATHVVIRGGVEVRIFIGPSLRNAQLRTRSHILRLHVHAFERLGHPGTVQPAIQESRIQEKLIDFGVDVLGALRSDNVSSSSFSLSFLPPLTCLGLRYPHSRSRSILQLLRHPRRYRFLGDLNRKEPRIPPTPQHCDPRLPHRRRP